MRMTIAEARARGISVPRRKPTVKLPRQRSPHEEALARKLDEAGLVGYVREYRFAPPRRFRFDFCWQDQKVAVEVDGEAPGGAVGHHGSREMVDRECEKYYLAALLGWRVIRVTSRLIEGGQAVAWLRALLAGSPAPE